MSSTNKDSGKLFKIITLILTIIILIAAIWTLIITNCSYSLQKSQIKMPDLYIDCSGDIKTTSISLNLVNGGEVPAHRVYLTVFVPYITKNLDNKGLFQIQKEGFCNVFKANDSTLKVNFYEKIIYPTLLHKQYYPIVDFKFRGAIEKELKETKKSLKYIINAEEGNFSGSIPIIDIFKD